MELPRGHVNSTVENRRASKAAFHLFTRFFFRHPPPSGKRLIGCRLPPQDGTTEGENMYTVAALIVMAILLEAVMTVLHSVLGTVGLGDTIKKLPIIGANLTLGISILIVLLLKAYPLQAWGVTWTDDWKNMVVNGAVICGMIPLKDAVFGAIAKGMRA